jgi:RNA-binding protein with serine-rich domain 1
LTKNVTADHVKEIFTPYGNVVDLDMPVNRKCKPSTQSHTFRVPFTQRSFVVNINRGIAYVTYGTKKEAEEAILYMHEVWHK